MPNANLHKAKDQKNDEFYTQLPDIERELNHYEEQLKGKVIFCNCDDPYESNFFKYFALRFNFSGIKKLIATCYAGSPIANKELSLFPEESEENKTTRNPHKIEITEIPDMNNDGAVGLTDVELLLGSDKNHLTRLKGDGDFRSEEIIELLKQADIVVTNPPFSLFREYVSQLIEYGKKFVIIGNKNAITYKEVFKLIRENKMWIGNTPMGIDMLFDVPEYFAKELIASKKEGSGYKIVKGVVKGRSQSIWFTNLDVKKRHEELILYRKYNEKDYPKYDNYDAINVDSTKDIPCDYDGAMGVPITFMDKYNPDQFEIISANDVRVNENIPFKEHGLIKDKEGAINGKPTYVRILIKKKEK